MYVTIIESLGPNRFHWEWKNWFLTPKHGLKKAIVMILEQGNNTVVLFKRTTQILIL